MTPIRWAMTLVGLALLAGCSSQPRGGEMTPQSTALQDLDGLIRSSGGSRVPAKLADLARHQGMYPRGYEAVKSGDVVVLWGAELKGEGEVGKNETVVAYEKTVPKDGGYVLLSAGTVKKMTAAEFSAAPMAGKK